MHALGLHDYKIFVFSAHTIRRARYTLSPIRLSACLSVTRVDQSKTVEVRN